MSNTWLRLYSEFASDPKVQMMPESLQRRLIMIFCMRCDNSKYTEEELAFYLRISVEEVFETKKVFISKNFIDDEWNIIHWDERQFVSDKSNERVKKYREKRYSQGLTANGYTKHSVTVTQRDGNCCVYCGSTNNLCIDHILPVCQDGTDDIENLACACKQCNSGKAGKTPDQSGYSFLNKECERQWKEWMCNRVTVTVTPQKQSRAEAESDSERKKAPSEIVDRSWQPPPSDAQDLDLNDFACACAVLAELLGKKQLARQDQETVGKWCATYDMRAEALPLIGKKFKQYFDKNGAAPKSLKYFDNMLAEGCKKQPPYVELGKKLRAV